MIRPCPYKDPKELLKHMNSFYKISDNVKVGLKQSLFYFQIEKTIQKNQMEACEL